MQELTVLTPYSELHLQLCQVMKGIFWGLFSHCLGVDKLLSCLLSLISFGLL